MTTTKNIFTLDRIQQLEIGRNGNIMPRIRDLDYDSTLQGSLLRVLYPAIRVASVLVPVEPLEEVEEARVCYAMAKLVYKGVTYKLVGAASSAKKGLFYFVDEDHHLAIAQRFQNWPQAAITYFGILVSNCKTVVELPNCRVLVVSDKNLGTNDCRGWIRESIAVSQLRLSPRTFAQFRIAFDKVQGKGSLKVMSDEAADILGADIILPESSIKPGFKVPAKAFEFFGMGRRFQGAAIVGIREVARRLEFESSYTLTQHAPGDSILTEILPQTKSQIDRVSNAVEEGRYEELLELIGHSPDTRVGLQPEEEVGTVEGLLLADTSGHIVKHPWVNAQLDKLLARWTYKACTGGAFHLPAFALADDGYLIAVDGKIFHGADWIPQGQSVSVLNSKRGLCVRYPIRMYEDLLPTKHISKPELINLLSEELLQKKCDFPGQHAEVIAERQVLLDGTYVLHSETAKLNGGDFDFDLVGVVDEDRFPVWVAHRFNLKEQFPLTKTKASKEKHPWWNIVHVARKAVGNQIGSITDLITSCLAEGRTDLAETLVVELQNALDSLKHGVEPDQEKISAIRQQVTQAPWLRFKNERKVSDLPVHVEAKENDKIGTLWNHVRPHFDALLERTASLEQFIGLIDGEQITAQMIDECHHVQTAYGYVVASIAQRKTELKKVLEKANQEWEAVRKSDDKQLRKQKMFARNRARAAYFYSDERGKDEMKAIIGFVKIWAQNKTENRMAWAQALNSIVCKSKRKGKDEGDGAAKKGTGSLIWLTFPQEVITRLAALTGGKSVRIYRPRMVEGFVRRDEHGRTYLVEAVEKGLHETFLFSVKDGQFSLDDTINLQPNKEESNKEEPNKEPEQKELPTEAVPIAQTSDEEVEGLGHEEELLQEEEIMAELAAGTAEECAPF